MYNFSRMEKITVILLIIALSACTKKTVSEHGEFANDSQQLDTVEAHKSNEIDKDNNNISDSENIQNELNIVKYVISHDGLRVRNTPSIDGEIIGILYHLAEVKIIREDINPTVIDNITGKWVYIAEPLRGWVFDGYLIYLADMVNLDDLSNVKELIAGNWICSSSVYMLFENFKFREIKLETSFGAAGYWEIINNKLIITITEEADDFDKYQQNYKKEYEIKFVEDMLILTPLYNDDYGNKIPDKIFTKITGNINNFDNVWDNYVKWTDRFGGIYVIR